MFQPGGRGRKLFRRTDGVHDTTVALTNDDGRRFAKRITSRLSEYSKSTLLTPHSPPIAGKTRKLNIRYCITKPACSWGWVYIEHVCTWFPGREISPPPSRNAGYSRVIGGGGGERSIKKCRKLNVQFKLFLYLVVLIFST